MLGREPETSDMLKNIFGVSLATVPIIAAASYLSNKYKMKEMREAIDKTAISNVNAKSPILSPDDVTGNVDSELNRKRAEISLINKVINKRASGSVLENTIKRAAPMMALPVATWLTATAVNKILRKRYGEELDAENARLQDMQNMLDIQELERLGYIRNTPNAGDTEKAVKSNSKADGIDKKASILDFGGDVVRGITDGVSTLGGVVKKGGFDLPLAIALLGTAGLSAFGIHHFLKETDDVKKLKLLKKKMLGSDRLLDSPALSVTLPTGYEETGKNTAQLLPGISPALIPNNVVESADIVEKPKKDAFLG